MVIYNIKFFIQKIFLQIYIIIDLITFINMLLFLIIVIKIKFFIIEIIFVISFFYII